MLDERGKELARSRDADALLEQHGGRARAALRSAAPASDWERKGLTAWTFGELPPVVTRRVGGLELRGYPAFFDRGAAVDLVLLETSSAADAVTRTGVRRLLMLAARGHVAVSAARMPLPFPSLDGAPPARGQADAFRALVLARGVDDAFKLAPGAPLPRTKEAVRAPPRRSPRRSPHSRPHQGGRAARRPCGTSARSSGTCSPRTSPSGFPSLARRATVRDQEAARELRWVFEELRVAIFAPEVTTPVSVTVVKVGAALAALR